MEWLLRPDATGFVKGRHSGRLNLALAKRDLVKRFAPALTEALRTLFGGLV